MGKAQMWEKRCAGWTTTGRHGGGGKGLDRSKTGTLVLQAGMFKGPKQEYKWRPAHLLPLCLKAINEANKLLNKICPSTWMTISCFPENKT